MVAIANPYFDSGLVRYGAYVARRLLAGRWRHLAAEIAEYVYYRRHVRPAVRGARDTVEYQACFWRVFGPRWMREFRRQYGARSDDAPLERHPEKTRRIVEEILALEPLQVFEFGCGFGLTLSLLRADRPDLPLTGVDVSEEQIRMARKQLSGADLRVVDAGQSVLSNRRHDVVLTSGVLVTVPPEGLHAVLTSLVAITGKYLVIQEETSPSRTTGVRPYKYPGVYLFWHDYPAAVVRTARAAGRDARLVRSVALQDPDGRPSTLFVFRVTESEMEP